MLQNVEVKEDKMDADEKLRHNDKILSNRLKEL